MCGYPQLAAGGGQACNPLSVAAFSTLLAAPEPCAQQNAADNMIDLAKQLKGNAEMIRLTQLFRQTPRNAVSKSSFSIAYSSTDQRIAGQSLSLVLPICSSEWRVTRALSMSVQRREPKSVHRQPPRWATRDHPLRVVGCRKPRGFVPSIKDTYSRWAAAQQDCGKPERWVRVTAQ